jgi:DNA-binding response OmpR family regulator
MSIPEPRVIVVEDEPDLNATTVSFLNLSGFVADGVRSATELKAWLMTHECDLAVLDLGLPDCTGLSLIQTLRAGRQCAIVLVTARGQLDDRLTGYATGADHYLVKPVDLRELVAVLNTLRGRLAPPPAEWRLDPLGWQLTAPNGRPVRLTQSELAILKALMDHPGQPVTRLAIAEALDFRGINHDPRRLEILIRRLRKKISDETGIDAPIETAHGVGYAFTADIRSATEIGT